MVCCRENFGKAFSRLDRLLTDYESLWTESAFVKESLSWLQNQSALGDALLRIGESELEELQDERLLLNFLSPYVPGLGELVHWETENRIVQSWQTPENALFGLPGRKRRQTEGFVSAVLSLSPPSEPGSRWVDWCSGRGYLARQLHFAAGAEVHCFELDGELCRSGSEAHCRISRELGEKVVFHQQDVLSDLPSEILQDGVLHTALHACGDLHISMLCQAAAAQAPYIACSPCCYHLISAEAYQPLSQFGQISHLRPTRQALRLATAETCTANTLERELRHRELLWRTAFDLRLRECNGRDRYTPTPSVKKSLLKTSFRQFAEAVLNKLNRRGDDLSFFPLSPTEESQLLQKAEAKMWRVRRMEKAQLGFRRALEYWLLLDRALFLEEQGYAVSLQQFCKKSDSGRNTVILGRLRS